MTANVGFIGLGVMGRSMAAHLLEGGHPLFLYNRTREKARPLLERGAQWADSPAQMASFCSVIFTIVGFPQDVEEVYLGPEGLLTAARPGTLFVDMTTSSPSLAIRISEVAAARGAAALDAPVSGGDRGAREATLSIMVGGDAQAFERALPYLRLLGRTIVHQGPPGSGQACKLCNQIVIAGTMIGVCEALAFARQSGLNPDLVLQSIGSGAAASWTLQNLAPRILAGQFEPGFFVKHFIKDMRLALAWAEQKGLDLPGLRTVLSRYEALAARDGGENLGTQGLYLLYDPSFSPAAGGSSSVTPPPCTPQGLGRDQG